MEKEIFDSVRHHWEELNGNAPVPRDFLLLKVQGKLARNASLVGLVLDVSQREPVAVVKVPRNPAYTGNIEAEAAGLAGVKRSTLSDEVLRHIPYGTVLGRTANQTILLQSACKGHSMVRELTTRKRVEHLYGKIIDWMIELHAAGLKNLTLGDAELARWVNPTIRRLKQELPVTYESFSDHTKYYLASLGDRIRGRRIAITQQHGDFNAHNVLVSIKGATLAHFWLIDWEDYSEQELPILDLNHFFVSNSKVLDGRGSAESTFSKFILSQGWYRDLYVRAVQLYTQRCFMDEDVFWALTPLYFVSMCLRVTDEGREEGHTVGVWARRAEAFIEHSPELR